MHSDDLGFSVRIATTEADFAAARSVRAIAYGRNDPSLGFQFGQAEALDTAEGSAVLVCHEKASGRAVGTARIQISAFGPLVLEDSVALPDWLAAAPRAQISRLAILAGAEAVVKLALMKVSWQYCLATQVHWMVIGARKPALIRSYRALGFQDVFDADTWVPLASGGGLPHRILALDVVGAQANWKASGNRLYGFMVETAHRDLPALAPVAAVPAAEDAAAAVPVSDFAALA